MSEHIDSPQEEKKYHCGTLVYTSAGLVALFLLLLAGDFFWSLRDRSVSMITRLLFKQFGASDMVNGLLISSVPSILGAIIGPIVSYRSDRLRSRWGRRIPYLFFTTPIVFLAMVGLAFSPMLGEWASRTFGASVLTEKMGALIFLGAFWILFEFGVLVAGSVFTALINDVVPRQFLGRFYGLFRIVSLSAGIIFNWWLLGKAETHYMYLFIIMGSLYGVGFLVMCLKVKEGEYPPPPQPKPGTVEGPFSAPIAYFRESFGVGYYVYVFLMLKMIGFVFMPLGLYLVFFAKALEISMDTYGKYIAISFAISFCLTYFLGMLVDKFHPFRCCIATIFLYMISSFACWRFVEPGWKFAAAVIAYCVISGIYWTVSASLNMRIFPKERYAQFCSASGLIGTVGSALMAPAIGRLLDYTNHDYRLLFLLSGIFSFLALVMMVAFLPMYRARDGFGNYVPPPVE